MASPSVKTRKPGEPIWPEVPCGRADIDLVHEHLLEWATWAEVGRDDVEKNKISFLNSVVHYIECALVLCLAPYAEKRGFDSDIFRDSNELDHACTGYVFQHGYWLEMANALRTCYSLEQPWEISPESAKKYANDLTGQLKEIALYQIEASDFWEQQLQKFKGGRKPGSQSKLKKYVTEVLTNQVAEPSKKLWQVLCEKVGGNSNEDDIPLSYDTATEKLFETTGSCKEYTFARFEKHMSELRNK